MAVTLISTENVTFTAVDNPPGVSVTVPADCEAVYMFWAYNTAAGQQTLTATLDGNALDASFSITYQASALSGGVGVFYSPSTGTITLDPAWTNAVSNSGRVVILAYVKGGTTTWRDADGDSDTATTAVSVTIDSSSTDLVMKFDYRYDASETPGGTSTGWTSQATFGNNDCAARLSTADSPGASTTVCDCEDEFYSGVVAVSVVDAGGPVPPFINVAVTG